MPRTIKKYVYILIALLFWCCRDNIIELPEAFVEKYIDIERSFSTKDFEKMKDFILENGERNLYDNQPCFYYDSINNNIVRLEPEINLMDNPEYDPRISDFNKMIIFAKKNNIKDTFYNDHYYYLLIVRKGDLENRSIFYEVPEGIQEEKVYIVNYYHENIDTIETDVLYNIARIEKAMDNY